MKDGVERWAKLDGISKNQLIASAVAEKFLQFETAQLFEQRARRADFATFDRIMSREGSKAPREGDEVSAGYKRRAPSLGDEAYGTRSDLPDCNQS